MTPDHDAPGRSPSSSVGLRLRDVSKTFPGMRALRDVSVDLPAGAVHALVGGNGSGKSTLIKILAGVYTGDPGGEIQVGEHVVAADKVTPAWAARAHLSFVHQDLGLVEEVSVAENLWAADRYPRRAGRIDWARLYADAQGEVDALGIPVSSRAVVGDLRPGEQTMVAISRAIRGREETHSGLLILDEPTTRLAASEVDELLATLRRFADAGQTIIYVSHLLEELFNVADSVFVLRDGVLVSQQPVEGLTESELVRLIVGSALPEMIRDDRRAQGAEATGRKEILSVRGLVGGPVDGLDLDVHEGEIVGLGGLGGSGRTSTLEMVFGALRPRAGEIRLDGATLPPGDLQAAMRAGVAYLPADRAGQAAFLDLPISDNLAAADPHRNFRGGFYRYRQERQLAREAVEQYKVRAASLDSVLLSLSGGNQQKVIVARIINLDPRLALFDEPTHGVDVGARAEIYRQIRGAVDRGMAVLVASSDTDELLTLCDRIVVLSGGRVVGEAAAKGVDRHWLGDRIFGGELHDATSR
jgi:ribose transport system ATP-binding protein